MYISLQGCKFPRKNGRGLLFIAARYRQFSPDVFKVDYTVRSELENATGRRNVYGSNEASSLQVFNEVNNF